MSSNKIVNIMNFVRAGDHRITYEELFGTFIKEIELCRNYSMPYTFMLQYDAIANHEYVEAIINNSDDPNMEVGVWFEMAQEQVEKAGLKWNGRPGYRWDWYVNPGMLMAYTLPQREALIDELMERFFSAFGYYPRSVGSWLLDGHSVEYMIKKYNVECFVICREQFGTDGYTLWGGYYNQGYYPSKKNIFMPAQTMEEQLGAPVFRLLGPDPIYQYDLGLDEHFCASEIQHVHTLEPFWDCGKNPEWVDWYLHTNFEMEDMGFSYTQTGQENSFLWSGFGDALKMQLDKIKKGVIENRWEVATLRDTARRFREAYTLTPATSITALSDWKNEGRQSVWFNCRFYRTNFYRINGFVGIRDIHLFDENHPERYMDTPAGGKSAIYDTLPLVDGYRWGGNDIHSILYLSNQDNQPLNAKISDVTSANEQSVLNITVDADDNKIRFSCSENGIEILSESKPVNLCFKYNSLENTAILSITNDTIKFIHEGACYGMRLNGATFEETEKGYVVVANNNNYFISFLHF